MPKYVGMPLPRVEDARLVTGRGVFAADIRLPGMLHAAFLRSPYAHARIKRIDVSKAKQLKGVVEVLTGKEVADVTKNMGELWTMGGPGPRGAMNIVSKITEEHPLAVNKVRYVGETVAMVAATDKYTAEDALELIDAEYEPLPVAVDLEQAAKPGAPLLFEEWGDNISYEHKIRAGDIERAFKECSRTFKEKFTIHRYTGAPTEPCACAAQYDPITRSLTLWSSTQTPHLIRFMLSYIIGVPEPKIRVIAPDVGGGFGIKAHFFPWEVLIPLLTMRTGKPVSYVEDRREHLMANKHGPGRVHDVEVGVKDGQILAWKERILQDEGAYPSWGGAILTLSAVQIPGPYRIPNVWVDGYSVVANKAPNGAYRGFGDPQMTYVRERMIDIIAEELKMDPAELRLKNMIQPGEFPYKASTGLVYDSGTFVECMNKAMEMAGYERLKKERRPNIGVGIANLVERSSARNLPASYDADLDSVTVRVEPTGAITVFSSSAPHGQGHETSLAQMAADEFGVDISNVQVVCGDTDKCPQGMGTWGSRMMVITGSALAIASKMLKEKMRRIVAHTLEARPEDLEFAEGKFYVREAPDKAMSMHEIAWAAYVTTAALPPDIERTLQVTYTFEPPNTGRFDEFGCGNFAINYSNQTHVVVVEVDPETGQVRIPKYVIVDDCGIPINPLIVEGQLQGGVCQGMGGTLYEEFIYDENGQLLNPTFMDYLVPTSMEMPELDIEHMISESPSTPHKAKGIGESSAVPAPAAIANAIADALKVKVIDLPLTPERVLSLIERRSGR